MVLIGKRISGITSIIALVTICSTFNSSCKKLTDAKTDSFRATKRDFGWFGTERTALLLHQFKLDQQAASSPSTHSDPLLKALNGINACWYPLEIESEKIKPIAQSKQISKLYDLAPSPVTEYAVPLAEMMLAIEKIPELRTINDSWKKQTARVLTDLPVTLAVDYALCNVGLGILAGVFTAATGGTAVAFAPLATGWATFACSIATAFTGLHDGVKAPLNTVTNPIKDAAAGTVGNVFDDKEGRRKSIEERLPIYRQQQGQLGAFVEESLEEMPKIGWDEMQRLQKLMRQLGSSSSTVPTYPSGTAKKLRVDQRCDEIPVLKQKGEFYSPDLGELGAATARQLKSEGYSAESIQWLGSGGTLGGSGSLSPTQHGLGGSHSTGPSPQTTPNPMHQPGSGLSNY